MRKLINLYSFSLAHQQNLYSTMKNLRSISVMLFYFGLLQITNAQIAGTAHDFSTESWAPATNRGCGVCHTTHQSFPVTSAPLWNHETTVVAGYTLYDSPTFDGSSTITDPGASSRLCLSCHDGTVALENFGGITSGTNYVDPSAQIGGVSGNDMSTEHPISFEYTDALATSDGGLFPPTTTNSGLGSTIDNDMLFNSRMECASCHDVHNSYGVPHLLKMSNINSELCLTCHNK
jgi:predicted CXXCH cytochrome family protein